MSVGKVDMLMTWVGRVQGECVIFCVCVKKCFGGDICTVNGLLLKRLVV